MLIEGFCILEKKACIVAYCATHFRLSNTYSAPRHRAKNTSLYVKCINRNLYREVAKMRELLIMFGKIKVDV